MDKLQNIYYQPNHSWKGQKAIKKLPRVWQGKTNSHQEMVPTVIKKWLSQEAIWEVHLPHLKQVDRPHYEDKIPNQMHQFDLLYMPSDMLYGNKYTYILSEINVASRYKVARPLRTTQAANIAEMIADIYKVDPLTYPEIFQCDNGSEFKGEVTRLLEKYEVMIRRTTTKYKHTHTAFVEALTRSSQSNYSRYKMHKSYKHLYELADHLNDTKSQMIGVSLKDVIGLKEVPLVNQENYLPEDTLPEDGLYRYLLQPGEEHGDQHKEQCMEYDLRPLTDLVRSHQVLAIALCITSQMVQTEPSYQKS